MRRTRDAQPARRRLLNRRCSRLAATGANARRSLHYDAIKRVLNAMSGQIEREKERERANTSEWTARRDEHESAARGQTRETPRGCSRTGEDRLKALLAGLRTCERIGRGVSTNPFSTFLILPPAARGLTFTDVSTGGGRGDTMSGLIRTSLIKRNKENRAWTISPRRMRTLVTFPRIESDNAMRE